MTPYFLGVDGGQSSTSALVADAHGRVFGKGKAGPCNHVATEEARARFTGAIGGAVAQALEAAGLPRETRFRSACLGLSGGPADKDAVAREIVAAEQYVITNDAVIALSGATAGEPGVIVIAGTGSIAWGRNAEGRTARAGGWGYIFGDEGGGFDLARQGLRAALRYEEGWGPRTALRDALLHATGARDVNDLLHRCYTPEFPRARIAGYAPLVDEAAARGDGVARDLLQQAAQALAALAAAVRAQLFTADEAACVSYAGGVFASTLLLERFTQAAGDVRPPRFEPAAGALLEAYRAAGLAVLPLLA